MAVIFIEGFEKHAPSPYNIFTTNLYEANNNFDLANASLLKDWTSMSSSGNSMHVAFMTGRDARPGSRCLYASAQLSGQGNLHRNLPAPKSRVIVGVAMRTELYTDVGFNFFDGTTSQMDFWIDVTGRLHFARNGTPLYVSTQFVYANTWHYIEVDLTVHNTTGAFQIWLDGVSLTSATGQNTRVSSNNQVDGFRLMFNGAGVGYDDIYMLDATGSANNAARGDSGVQTLWPSADDAVQFTPEAYAIGWFARQVFSSTDNGANTLFLVPIRPEVDCTLASIQFDAQATSVSAKFKGAVYSDSSGAPGSLLSDGTEVVGCVTSTNVALPLATPQSLTAGTQYWIGMYGDTQVNFSVAERTFFLGQRKGATYASGAPAGPLSGMSTGQGTYRFWGVATGAASNFALVDRNQPGAVANLQPLGFVSDDTAGHEDLYAMDDLPGTSASIACVQVSGILSKDQPGTRTADVRVKSGSTDSAGGSSNFALAMTPAQFASVFETDPDTGSAWTDAAVNAMRAGVKVNT